MCQPASEASEPEAPAESDFSSLCCVAELFEEAASRRAKFSEYGDHERHDARLEIADVLLFLSLFKDGEEGAVAIGGDVGGGSRICDFDVEFDRGLTIDQVHRDISTRFVCLLLMIRGRGFDFMVQADVPARFINQIAGAVVSLDAEVRLSFARTVIGMEWRIQLSSATTDEAGRRRSGTRSGRKRSGKRGWGRG